ncbi:MAG: FAD-dependent oxidoreductase [Gemmatimonadaceae bacterium]
MTSQRTVIVGSGVIGLCAAYYALKRGMAVTVLERGEADGDCCSLGNAGMVVPSHFVPLASPGMIARGLRAMANPESPFYMHPRLDVGLMRWSAQFARSATAQHVAASRELLRDLHLESRRLFVELAAEDDFGLVQRGLLMLCKTAKGLDDEAHLAQDARDLGLQADVLDAARTASIEPNLSMDVAGSVYFAQDCHLDPVRFVDAMRRRVLSMGGEIVYNAPVDRIEASRGAVTGVRSAGRLFEGQAVVVAAGSWSADLLSTVGCSLLLQAGKGYSLTLPSPPQLPSLCAILTEASVAVTPMGGRLRFAGTMELAGLDRSINRSRVQGIIKSVGAYLPQFGPSAFDNVAPWAGLRPVSADGVPYVGKVERLPNLIVATGHAMMGMSLGPVTGRLVAELLAGDTPFLPIGGMSPGRF